MADSWLTGSRDTGRHMRAASIAAVSGFGCWWLLRLPWQRVLVEPFYPLVSLVLTILSFVGAPLLWLFDWIMLSAVTPSVFVVDLLVAVAAVVYFGGLGWGLARLATRGKKRWLALAVLAVAGLHIGIMAMLSLRAAAGLAAQEAARASPDSPIAESVSRPVIAAQTIQSSFLVVRPVVSERDDRHPHAATFSGEPVYFDSDTALFTERDIDPSSIEIERREWSDGTESWLVLWRLRDDPAASWGEWSDQNAGTRVGIFVDGELVQAPWIRSRMVTGLMVIELGWSRAGVERLADLLRQASSRQLPASAGFESPDDAPPFHDVALPDAPEEFRTLDLDSIAEAVTLLAAIQSAPLSSAPRKQLARLYEAHDLLGAARFFDNTVRLIDGESLIVRPVENPVAWGLTPEDLSGRAREAAGKIADVAASGHYEAAAKMAAAEIATNGMSNQVAAEWSWAALSLVATEPDRVSAEVYESALRTYLMCLEDKVSRPFLSGGKASAYNYLSKLLSEIGDSASGLTAACLALHYLESNEEGFPYTEADKARFVKTTERLSARTGGLTCP